MKMHYAVLTMLALLGTVMASRAPAQTSTATNRSERFAPAPPGGAPTNAWPRTNENMWPRTNENMWPRTNGNMWPRTNENMWPRTNDTMWPRTNGDRRSRMDGESRERPSANPAQPMNPRVRPGGPEPLPLDPPPTMPAPSQPGGAVPPPIRAR